MSDVSNGALRLDRDHPWPGLSSFHEEDASYFRGRGQEVDAVHRLVRREPLTVLFGRAGLGKTSLLRAGVFPALRAEQFLPVYCRLDYRSGTPLVHQVAAAIDAAARLADLKGPSGHARTLWEMFHTIGSELWDARHRIVTPVIVIDQFEEIFTQGGDRPDDVGTLIEQIADVVERRVPEAVRQDLQSGSVDPEVFDFERLGVRIVLSLREDFMPQLESLRPRLRGILEKRFRLEPMTALAAAKVLDAGRHLIADGVAEEIVRIVASDDSGAATSLDRLTVEPALLSVFSDELNKKRIAAGEPLITRDLLSGSQKSILIDFYERSVADLGTAVRRFVEEALLTTDGYRDSVALGRALKEGGVSPEAIAALVDRRIVRIERAGQVSRIELTHDLLTEVVRQSRDARREQEREAEQAAASTALAQTRRQLRRTRYVAALFLVLLVVAAGAVWLAYEMTDRARRAGEEALKTAGEKVEIAHQLLDSENRAEVERQRTHEQLVLAEAQEASRWTTFAASRLQEDSAADALASLAHALRRNADNTWARMMTFNLLLTRGWPRAEKVVQIGERVPAPFAASADGKRFIVAGPQVATVFDGATHRVRCRVRPGGNLASVAISGDGRHFAAGDYQTNLLFGDTEGCGTHSIAAAHEDAVTNLAFSPDGKWLASGGSDRAVRIWDVAKHTLHVPPFELGHSQVYDLRFSSKGTFLAASAGDANDYDLVTKKERISSAAIIWRVGDWTVIGKPLPSSDATTSVTFSADESRLILASRDGVVQERSIDKGELVGPLRITATPRESSLSLKFERVEFHPREEQLLSSSADGIRLWRTKPQDEERPFDFPAATIPLPARAQAHFSPDGASVLTASDDGVVRSWNDAGQPLMEPARSLSPVIDARFVNGGADMAAAYEDGKVIFWRVDRAIDAAVPLQSPPASFLTTADRRYAVSYSYNGRLTLIDLTTARPVRAVWLNTEQGCEAVREVSPDGSYVICDTGVSDRRILRTDINSQLDYPFADWRHDADDRDGSPAATTVKALRALGGRLHFTPNPDLVVEERASEAQQWDFDVYVHDRAQRWRDGAFLRNAGAVMGFDRLGKRLLTKSLGSSKTKATSEQIVVSPGAGPTILHVWDLGSGKEVARISAGEARFGELDPTGTRLVYVTRDGTATVWDIGSNRRFHLRHSDIVNHASFSADGNYVVTASKDQTARVWRADNGVSVGRPLRHPGAVKYAALSADGRLAVTVEASGAAGLYDGATRVWDVETGLVLRTFAEHSKDSEHPAKFDDGKPVFTADGRLITFDGANLKLPDFRAGTKEEAALLADLAEAVSGRRVADEGVIVDVPNGIDALRAVAARAKGDGDAAKVARWFAADPRSRTVSPFSSAHSQ